MEHPFMSKVLKRLEMQRTYFNIANMVSSQFTAIIILNKEKLKTFPLKLEISLGCPLSPYSVSIVLEILARAIRQLKEIQGI